MKTLLPFLLRGRAVATTGIAAALLSLSLTGCGGDTSDADTTAPTGRVGSAPALTPDGTQTENTTDPTSPTPPTPPASDEPSTALSSLGRKDKMRRVAFPGPDVVFADSGSASSDGKTLNVTTPAEEKFSVELPGDSEGWIYDVTIDLGDAGTGYLVTQSGGEYISTFLVVLDQGKLYLPKPDDTVIFGQFAGEGPFFETYTTHGGAHLVTHVEDTPDGDADYEWAVEDGTMVPTLLS